MGFWQWIVAGLLAVIFVFNGTFISGCAIDKILSSGPDAMTKVADGQKALMIHAMDGLQASTGQMSARGEVKDPTYRGKTFVGTGVYFDMELSLQGVQLTGSIMAGLVARVQADPALRADLIKILHNTELNEQAKRDAIMEVIRRTIDLIAKEQAKPEPPPTLIPLVDEDVDLIEEAVDVP